MKVSYSLLSALYNNTQGGGLYNDIYYPAIKYILVQFAYSLDRKQYYDVEDVHQEIVKVFGLDIPLTVIKKSIVRLSKERGYKMTEFENGSMFSIESIKDVSVNIDIDNLASKFEKDIVKLESDFSEFKKQRGVDNDVTFVDFVSSNTTEILTDYAKKEKPEQPGEERFALVARYLDGLKNTNPEEFKLATDIFWSSIIAAFLTRKNEVTIKALTDSPEYYFDTPLIMGILDLSSEELEVYAKDLLQTVTKAGAKALVHPLTIMEAQNIISAQEKNPMASSIISSAVKRYNLTPAKLAEKRTSIRKLLEKAGLTELPKVSDYELKKLVEQKAKSDIVTRLKIQRNLYRNQSTSFYYDDIGNDTEALVLPQDYNHSFDSKSVFREIHDIYLTEFVNQRRDKISREVSFVTWNRDLISYTREKMSIVKESIIHPAKLITNLWLFSTTHTRSDMPRAALTEAIARSLLVNNIEVERNLYQIKKIFGENNEPVTDEQYSGLMCSLIERDTTVINSASRLLTAHKNNDKSEQKAEIQQLLQEVNKKSEVQTRELVELTTEHENAVRSMAEKDEEIKRLKSEQIALTGRAETATAEKDDANKREQRLRELVDYTSKKAKASLDLASKRSTLESEIEDYIRRNNWKLDLEFRMPYIFTFIIIAAIICLIVMGECSDEEKWYTVLYKSWLSSGITFAAFISLIGLLINLFSIGKNLIHPDWRKDAIIEKYNERANKTSKVKSLNQAISSLEVEIADYDSVIEKIYEEINAQ